MGSAHQSPNYARFNRLRERVIKALNNVYVVTGVTRQAVQEERERLKRLPASKRVPLEVPAIDGRVVPIDRRKGKMTALLKKAVRRDLFAYALISAVALVEDFVTKVISEVLAMHPKKISLGVGGGASSKKVEMDTILSASSLQDLHRAMIRERVSQLLYASPTDYLQYVRSVLSIDVLDDLAGRFFEVKATRDVLVHNEGRINDTYLRKAGALARGSVGQEVPLDEGYFTDAVRDLKSLVAQIYRECLRVHGGTPSAPAATQHSAPTS